MHTFYHSTGILSRVTFTWSLSLQFFHYWPSYWLVKYWTRSWIVPEMTTCSKLLPHLWKPWRTGPKTLHRFTKDACWFLYCANNCVAYTLPSSNITSEVCSLWLRKNIPANRRTPCWRLWLDIFDVRSLLSLDCGAFGVNLNTSNISHDSVGCSAFSCRPFGTGDIEGN